MFNKCRRRFGCILLFHAVTTTPNIMKSCIHIVRGKEKNIGFFAYRKKKRLFLLFQNNRFHCKILHKICQGYRKELRQRSIIHGRLYHANGSASTGTTNIKFLYPIALHFKRFIAEHSAPNTNQVAGGCKSVLQSS